MNNLVVALALPLFAGAAAWLSRRLRFMGALLTIGAAGLGLLLTASLPVDRTFAVGGGLSLEWTPTIRLFVLPLWGALALFGLLELARPGRNFVIPAILAATGLTLVALTARPLTIAFLAMQISGLLLVFPGLEGPARRAWGTLGYLVVIVVSGATAQMGLSLAEFYTQNPDETTARIAAALFSIAAGLTLALIPLHFWLPRLTETAPYQVAAWIGMVGQMGIVGLVLRLLHEYDWLLSVTPMIYTFVLGGLASVILGGALALAAATPRHWLAYAMIFDIGMAATGLGLFARLGADGAALLLLTRMLAVFLAAAGLRTIPKLVLDWDDLRGIGHTLPLAALAIGMAAAALAGIPPFPGFPGVWLVFRAAYSAAPALAFLLAPGAALMAFSVVRLVVILVEAPGAATRSTLPLGLAALIVSVTLLLLGLGLFPQVALEPITMALATLRFLP